MCAWYLPIQREEEGDPEEHLLVGCVPLYPGLSLTKATKVEKKQIRTLIRSTHNFLAFRFDKYSRPFQLPWDWELEDPQNQNWYAFRETNDILLRFNGRSVFIVTIIVTVLF